MAVGLADARDPQALGTISPRSGSRIGGDDECRPAVGNRAAIKQSQRVGDGSRGEDVLHGDRRAQMCAGCPAASPGASARRTERAPPGPGRAARGSARQAARSRPGRSPERYLVVGFSDLRQSARRRVAALPAGSVLTGHDQHGPGVAAADEPIGGSHHRQSGRATHAHAEGDVRTDAHPLGKPVRRHEVTGGGGVAADDGVDVARRQARVAQGQPGSRGLPVERGTAGLPANAVSPTPDSHELMRWRPAAPSQARRGDPAG